MPAKKKATKIPGRKRIRPEDLEGAQGEIGGAEDGGAARSPAKPSSRGNVRSPAKPASGTGDAVRSPAKPARAIGDVDTRGKKAKVKKK